MGFELSISGLEAVIVPYMIMLNPVVLTSGTVANVKKLFTAVSYNFSK